MKAFKTVILVAALGIVGYGVYTAMTKPNKKRLQDASPAPLFRADTQGGDTSTSLAGAWDASAPSQLKESADASTPLTGKQPGAAEFSGAEAHATDAVPAADGTRALETVTQVTSTQPLTAQQLEARFAEMTHEFKNLVAQRELAKAQRLLSDWYPQRHQLPPDLRAKLMRALDDLTGTVLYSQEHFLMPPHKVVAGETTEQIAARYAVPWRLLAKINGISDAATLAPGTELKVLPGPLHAEVDLSHYELTLYLVDNRYAGRFSIGLGLEVPVQEGRFQVTQKIEKPPYRRADGTTFQPGDPRNPLGQLLIEVNRSFAIHGTPDPASLGKTNPEGCIRMAARDMDDLYDMLLEGKSNVSILR